jgi:hypothetical protein
MAHQVHVALMRAGFSPARIKGEPVATEFLVTFRIFDNISYPFSPLQEPDSSLPQPLTADYFMTYYYSENDISLYPLPRKRARGYIRAPQFADEPPGFANVLIGLDQTGTLVHVGVLRVRTGLRRAAAEVTRLITWYPAVNNRGEPVSFSGMVRLEFRGEPEIVYIPEWLPP